MLRTRFTARLAALTASSLLASPALAQTLGPGVFDTPPTVVPFGTTLVSSTTLNVLPGSNISILTVGDPLAANTDVVVNVRGGELDIARVNQGSTINFESGSITDFNLDLPAGTALNVSGGSLDTSVRLTGDGAFSLSDGTVSSVILDSPDAQATITGGRISNFLEVSFGAQITIPAGEINRLFAATSTIGITGGSFPIGIDALQNSDISISGGEFGPVTVWPFDNKLRITGGVFESVSVGSGPGFASISGGAINRLGAGFGRPARLFGTEFLLDGQPIPGLTPGVPYQLTERNQTLTGFFADGSPFNFDLEPDPTGSPDDFFSVDANVTLHLVPEPTSSLLLLLAATTFAAGNRRRR